MFACVCEAHMSDRAGRSRSLAGAGHSRGKLIRVITQ